MLSTVLTLAIYKMQGYLDTFVQSLMGTIDWTWKSIIFQVPWYTNYFWGLILISLIVWGLEIAFPWRKNQRIIRKDFWLDTFYMFFNFFIFAIAISGIYALMTRFFAGMGIAEKSLTIVDLS